MKRLLAWLLCLCCLPMGGLAGGEYRNPFDEEGVAAAFDGTEWADWSYAGCGLHLGEADGAPRAVVVLERSSDGPRVLFWLTRRDGRYIIDGHAEAALCQGHCGITVYGGEEFEDPATLFIDHQTTSYTNETYAFRMQGGEWVFAYAVLRSAVDADTPDTVNAAYYTWANGRLRAEWYGEGDLEGLSPAPIGENRMWKKIDRDAFVTPWPSRITLAGFAMEDFPRDAESLRWRDRAEDVWSSCAWKRGARYPGHTYCAVNNPNPADRLNLRKQPDASSLSEGKYYNGLVMRVMGTVGEWTQVSLGFNNAGGYMLTKFLAFGEEVDRVESAMPRHTMPARAWTLYYGAFEGANEKRTFAGGEEIEVLGVVSDWWHVRVDGSNDLCGYIRAWE